MVSTISEEPVAAAIFRAEDGKKKKKKTQVKLPKVDCDIIIHFKHVHMKV
jgi:hypothetical protein